MEQEGEKMRKDLETSNNLLRLKVEESKRWEDSHRETMGKYEEVFAQYRSKSEESLSIKNKLLEYELSISKLVEEFERLKTLLEKHKKENYELRKTLQSFSDLEDKVHAA